MIFSDTRRKNLNTKSETIRLNVECSPHNTRLFLINQIAPAMEVCLYLNHFI